jgi:small subunit ribosomal protein S1
MRSADADECPWELPLDEDYWQALLQQGEHAPQALESPPPLFFDEGPAINPDHHAQLSQRRESRAGSKVNDARERGWRRLYERFQNREVFRARVIGCNKGGLLVRLGECIGFVPASQLAELPECLGTYRLRDELERMVGQELELRIIELDRSRNRIICSERATTWIDGEIEARLNSLHPGQIVRGRIRSLCEFGAFVDLGGIDGLIHISEISWQRVNHPRDVLEVGQEVEVYVLNVDREQRRIGLSLRQLEPDPWSLVAERYRVGDLVDAVITNVVDFGAFARIPEGVEGLIHISELAEGHFLHPRNVVQEGEQVTARILNIDPENRRLGLSLRQVWERQNSLEKEPF